MFPRSCSSSLFVLFSYLHGCAGDQTAQEHAEEEGGETSFGLPQDCPHESVEAIGVT